MRCINCKNLCQISNSDCVGKENAKFKKLFCKKIEKEISQKEAQENIFCVNYINKTIK